MVEFEETYFNQSALMAMQAGVEIAQAYYKAVRKHAVTLHRLDLNSGASADDEALHEQMRSISYHTTPEFFETVVYLRRRRNHLIHQLEEPSSEMKKFGKMATLSVSTVIGLNVLLNCLALIFVTTH